MKQSSTSSVSIIVATHKQYWMPEDPLFRPIQVGFADPVPSWLRDDTGDQIAERNRTFCELTALYWIWKNTATCALSVSRHCRIPSR